MLEEFVGDGLAAFAEAMDRVFQVDRVPEHDRPLFLEVFEVAAPHHREVSGAQRFLSSAITHHS